YSAIRSGCEAAGSAVKQELLRTASINRATSSYQPMPQSQSNSCSLGLSVHRGNDKNHYSQYVTLLELIRWRTEIVAE
ncbi:MAG: hypothetical protein WAN09_16440, partial [Candidatus Korobacteraceae bacterium]